MPRAVSYRRVSRQLNLKSSLDNLKIAHPNDACKLSIELFEHDIRTVYNCKSVPLLR
jgi:hypothetical protein